MADLADRVIKTDPRYKELDEALSKIRALLNRVPEEGAPPRLQALSTVEETLRDFVKKLMPSLTAKEGRKPRRLVPVYDLLPACKTLYFA